MYDCLIFEGGGVKGMCYVGALDALTRYGLIDLQKIQYFGGTSAGSIIATLLASGHTVQEICEIMLQTKWGKMKDGNWFLNIFRLFNHFGYHKGQALRSLIDDILYRKTSIKGITFSQLYQKTGKHLKMVGTNLTTGKIEYMDHTHTPTMTVAQGVHISSCIPFVFEPVEYKNNLYVDGGLIRNLDLNMFTDKHAKVLAVEISDKTNIELKSLAGFGAKVFAIIYEEANKVSHHNATVISVSETKLNPLDFNLKEEDFKYLKSVGTKAVKDWLDISLPNDYDSASSVFV